LKRKVQERAIFESLLVVMFHLFWREKCPKEKGEVLSYHVRELIDEIQIESKKNYLEIKSLLISSQSR